jgi:hypothetical protein
MKQVVESLVVWSLCGVGILVASYLETRVIRGLLYDLSVDQLSIVDTSGYGPADHVVPILARAMVRRFEEEFGATVMDREEAYMHRVPLYE